MNKDKLYIGDQIVSLRQAMGLSRNELAERTGIEYQTLAKYETNKRTPSAEVISHLAAFFQVSTDYLLGTSKKPPSILKPQPKDLRKVLNEAELHLDGVPLTEDDKEKLRKAVELLFWDAKQQNKRKKS